MEMENPNRIKEELNSALYLARPLAGHHAEKEELMGCNNAAIAESYLLNEKPELGKKKILIVDWDVHHGNGTQKMFWKDSHVLFFSVHRHEFGIFYPATDDGSYTMIGERPGARCNIYVPLENGSCGDADYLAVWDHVLFPVAKEFNPDMIIIPAGFDAAINDPLGGCRVAPHGCSILLQKLMDFAQGKSLLALEGGYNLDSISNSVLACMEVLLEDKPINGSSEAYPFESTWRVIQAVRQKLSAFWPALADELIAELNSQKAPPHMMSSSDSVDEDDETPDVSENLMAIVQDVIDPLLKLKVEDGHSQLVSESIPWRLKVAKVEIWYASFGSNMWKSRFLCYIEGGKVEGMITKCSGSMDRNPPKEILWKTFPHRLFFGGEYTRAWGPGGVAFINPESNSEDETYMCLYRITLQQFNDVLYQENFVCDRSSPLFDMTDLKSIVTRRSISVEALKNGWYHNVLYLGKERDIPILTATCPLTDVESFKSAKLPINAPSTEYANTLIKGLVEGKQLSDEQAKEYIQEASTKPM